MSKVGFWKAKQTNKKKVFTAKNPRFSHSLVSTVDFTTVWCQGQQLQCPPHWIQYSSGDHFIVVVISYCDKCCQKKLIMHTWSVKIWNSWIQQTIQKWMRNNVMYVQNKTKQRKYFLQRKFKLTCITAEIRLAALSELTLRNKTHSSTEQHTKTDKFQVQRQEHLGVWGETRELWKIRIPQGKMDGQHWFLRVSRACNQILYCLPSICNYIGGWFSDTW